MKKAILPALLMSSALLFSQTTFADDPVELRMSWWGGNTRHQVTLKALEEFHKANPNIKVKAEYTGWEGHLSRLTTQIAGKTEPDVMQTNWNWLPIFSKDGNGFYDLNQVNGPLDLSQFDADSLLVTSVNGKLNAIPVSMTARTFYYNNETWKQAGLEYPKTWDELMQSGQVFNQKLGAQYYPMALEHMDILALVASYMTQKHNVAIVDEQNKKFNYTDAQWVEFFNVYKQLVDNHVIPSSKYYASFGKNNLYEMKPWIAGEWGGTYMWNSTITKYSDNLKAPAKLELGPYPMLEGATDAGLFFKPSLMFSIGKSSKHPKEAAILINFLLNHEKGVEVLGLERGVPLSKAGFAQLTASGVIQDGDVAVEGLRLAQSLPHTISISPYFDDPQMVELFRNSIQYIDYGQKSVDDTAMDFKRQGERILKRAMR